MHRLHVSRILDLAKRLFYKWAIVAAATEQAGELAGIHALVVDPDAGERARVAALLEAVGVAVTTAASDEDGLAAFWRARPEVLIAAGGDALVRRVRAATPADGGLTPAIAVGPVGSAEASLEAGFHVHLQAPVEPALLLDCVRDFVRSHGIGRAQWSVTARNGDLLLRFVGHVTATDMRNAVSMLARLLGRAAAPCRVLVDLRELSGFDPSVGFAAETTVWAVRHKIAGVVVVGGSALAHLVSRGACLVIGVPCETADTLP